MTARHQPATPLPWYVAEDRRGRFRIFSPKGVEVLRALYKAVTTKRQREQNRDYAAHAASAYPGMVEVLQMIADRVPANVAGDGATEAARAILRKIGER